MKNKFIFLLISIILLLNFIYSQEYVPGELIVKYNDSNTINSISTLSVENTSSENIKILKFHENENITLLAEEYSKLEGVEYAEPNYIYHNFQSTNDIYFSTQWYLQKISAEYAWNLTFGNSSQIIAIIDTGVDWNHVDLTNQIWNNTNEDCNESTDLDSNGYYGDCRGYDFVNFTAPQAAFYCDSGEDCTNEDNNPDDYQGHGTICAGIAAAEANNSIGVAGICPNCQIMALRAGYKDTTGEGSFTTEDVVEAINYAINNNATIISMSWGGSSSSSSINDSLTNAYNAGIILVAAAGNEGVDSQVYPAAYDDVISVGSTDSSDARSSFSNYGSWVNIAAPGSNISSTYPSDSYVYASGTSMAAPLVAGAIGLIKSIFSDANQSTILEALNSTGEQINFGGQNISRINIYSAILSLDETSPNVSINSSESIWANQGNVTFTCNATDELSLSNLTLKVYNSTGLHNILTNSSVINSSLSLNQTLNMTEDSYEFYCESYDSAGNYNQTTNQTLVITNSNIFVNQNSPSNNSYTNQNITNFTCSSYALAGNLSNITFSIYNSTDLLFNETRNISGSENTTIFNYTLQNETTYFWNCYAENNVSENYTTENFSITYDITFPNVTLISPTNNSRTTTKTQTFSHTENETNSDYCNLTINNINYTSFTQTLSDGTYYWNITCTDKANNSVTSETWLLTIYTETTTSSSSSGGGSSSSSSSSSGSAAVSTVITESQLETGVLRQLTINKEISFIVENETHKIKLAKLSPQSIILTISSTPLNVTISEGETKKFDLNEDDYYDFQIYVKNITSSNAEIIMEKIFEEIPTVQDNSTNAETQDTAQTKISFLKKIWDFIKRIFGIN